MEEFITKMGNPVLIDEFGDFQSLVYDELIVSGYQAFMVAYFSRDGLEGGIYYFNTFCREELIQCYADIQTELLGLYGAADLSDVIFRELRPYESIWDLSTGYIFLSVNTRLHEPVSLWVSSPALTEKITGQ